MKRAWRVRDVFQPNLTNSARNYYFIRSIQITLEKYWRSINLPKRKWIGLCRVFTQLNVPFRVTIEIATYLSATTICRSVVVVGEISNESYNFQKYLEFLVSLAVEILAHGWKLPVNWWEQVIHIRPIWSAGGTGGEQQNRYEVQWVEISQHNSIYTVWQMDFDGLILRIKDLIPVEPRVWNVVRVYSRVRFFKTQFFRVA